VKMLPRRNILQKDLPTLLVNFGTNIVTKPFSVVDH
jgi:hypothetical protein